MGSRITWPDAKPDVDAIPEPQPEPKSVAQPIPVAEPIAVAHPDPIAKPEPKSQSDPFAQPLAQPDRRSVRLHFHEQRRLLDPDACRLDCDRGGA